MATKERKTEKAVLLIALPLVALLCFALWYLRTNYLFHVLDYTQVESETGVWDFSGYDFENGLARASDAVEYIPGALLSPQEFEARSGEVLVGAADSDAVNTARLRILVPDDGVYMLAFHSVDFAERVYINGAWRQDVGRPGQEAGDDVPGYAYLRFEVEPEQGVIEIVRQSANHIHRDNGDPAGVLVGRPETIKRHLALTEGFTALTMGLFLALFLAHMLLFLMLRSYRANLYFALLCLTWCLRTGATGVKLLAEWFPALPWAAVFRLEYLSAPVAALLMLLVVREMFAGLLPKWFVRIAGGFFAVYAVCCLLLPTLPLSYTMVGFEAVYIASVLFIAVRLAVAMPRRARAGEVRPEHWVMLAGLALFLFAVVHDALYYNNIYLFGINYTLNDLALLVFSFFQMAAMFYATMRQVREARRAEEESRLEAEALRRAGEMKEQFLGGLFHELQMPITVVSGFAQLAGRMMDDETIDRAAIKEYMRRTDDEAGRMERMVTQLLDAAAIESGSFALRRKPMDMAELLHEVARVHFPVMDVGGNAVTVDAPPGLPLVYGDRERLLQVVLNLLSNAVKHTKCGTVALSARAVEGKVLVSVADTGGGIAPELLPGLFTRYPQHRETSGNGLGLYIAAQIVQAHGGEITVESKAHQGTAVHFTIPIAEREAG